MRRIYYPFFFPSIAKAYINEGPHPEPAPKPLQRKPVIIFETYHIIAYFWYADPDARKPASFPAYRTPLEAWMVLAYGLNKRKDLGEAFN